MATLLAAWLPLPSRSESAAEMLQAPIPLVDPSSGSRVALKAGDRVLHLVFFATWCPPCKEELPRLAEMEARWGDAGYRLVLIAVRTRHTVERLRDFRQARRTPGELLFDSLGSARSILGVERIPAHLVLNSRGDVILRAPALVGEVEEKIQELLAPSPDSVE